MEDLLTVPAVPAVPALPHLKTATDAGLMLEIFRKHLCSVPGKAWDIRSCEVSRVRAHPGESAVILYILRIADSQNGQERDQWVTGELDPAAHNELSWVELHAVAWSRNSTAFDTFDPVSFIDELGMLVQVYPFDRRLPGLADLTAGPPPELEPVLLAILGPGTWAAEWTVETVRYHALLRSTLQYSVQAQEAESGRVSCKRFYVKVYRGDEGEAMRRVLDGRSRQADGFTVPALLAYLPHLGALVLEEARGTSLRKLVMAGDQAEALLSHVGRALAAFHQGAIAGLPSHGLADELALIERSKAFLVSTCPHLQARIEAVFEALKARLQDGPPGPTHLALRLDPILIDGNRLWLIDLDSLSAADPLLDVAFFLAHLTSLRIRSKLDDEMSRRLARSFADAYFPQVPSAWRARLPVHYAGALLKAARNVYRRKVFRPNSQRWLDTITAMLKEAEDSLAGKVW
jgi:Phosphotransferase enzyme family